MDDREPLSSGVLLRLAACFRALGWDNAQELADEDEPDLFRRFCLLFEALTAQEQSLLLVLLPDFRRVPLGRYRALYRDALAGLSDELLVGVRQLVVCPLLSPCDFDEGNGKSSDMSARLVSQLLKGDHRLKNKTVTHRRDPGRLKDLPAKRTLVLLADDFVGSGDTASLAVRFAESSVQIPEVEYLVVCAVAQRQGVEAVVERTQAAVLCGELRGKAISDHPSLDVDEALRVMDELESRLGVYDRFRRGYASSEALVKFDRIANNTFPVFWLSRRGADGWSAPWSRN